MSVENIERILSREIAAQRRGRVYFTGLAVAIGIVVAAMFVAM